MWGRAALFRVFQMGPSPPSLLLPLAYYRGAEGILLVYDVTNESSFNNIHNWVHETEQYAPENANRILVGNKADMDESKRAVSTSKGQALADECGIKFFETSAMTNLNVEDIFFVLASDIKQRLSETDSRAEVCKSSYKITESLSKVGELLEFKAFWHRYFGRKKVGELKKMDESLHPDIGDVRRKINTEVVKKVQDEKLLKEKSIANMESSETFLDDLERITPKRFSHKELKKFTSDFAYKVGFGGFGHVYKGQFLNGVEIAVKVLAENELVKEVFEAEVSMMFKTSHRNLVKFYGYCSDDNINALVFEYMRNGSLDKVLYENHLCLEWERLYKISIDIAKGLAYLHDGCDEQIIHHDIKAANVLLDLDLSPKITDFGLAKLMSRDVSHVTWTRIRGTNGYIAPELCIPFSEITHKCDVYSFGMMMFEVLGMRSNGEGSEWFPRKVWSKYDNGELDEIIDYRGIHKREDRANAKILSMVALWCIQFTPHARPNMSTVVNMLEGEIQVKKPPNPFLPAPEVFYSKVSHPFH